MCGCVSAWVCGGGVSKSLTYSHTHVPANMDVSMWVRECVGVGVMLAAVD